jgi:hypothetical protein
MVTMEGWISGRSSRGFVGILIEKEQSHAEHGVKEYEYDNNDPCPGFGHNGWLGVSVHRGASEG